MQLSMADVGKKLGLKAEQIILYGNDKAKLPLEILHEPETDGKLILVSAMTPTPAGEGKTTTSIGLVQGLEALGERVCAALREPSLGPCFGIKGGGTGGGRSRLEPSADINLHFTGDLHAITAAHNLVSALIDNHLHFKNEPELDPRRVLWPRVLDQNDRALRNVVLGLGGRSQGLPRESAFDITAASEVMAILCLATGYDDLRARLSRTLIGYGYDRSPVTIADIQGVGAMMALLKDAMLPNLVQTTEGTPAIVHGGPFANIAHGCNSVIATRMAMKLADWTVTEAGFGMDLGGEKFFDIKCRMAELNPSAVVCVATIRALKYHGGIALKDLEHSAPDAVRRGLPNLQKHLETIAQFNKPAVVALNLFSSDCDEEISVVREHCRELGLRFAVSSHFEKGGAGAKDLAREVIAASSEKTGKLDFIYGLSMSVEDKIRSVAQKVYGARDIYFSKAGATDLRQIRKQGYTNLPICMAKTQSSLSDDPKRQGRPENFDLSIQALQVNAGAGFIVVITGDIMRMPGLPKRPHAAQVDLIDGAIIGVQ